MCNASRIWFMTSLYLKNSIFIHPHENTKQVFSKISALKSVFENMHFWWPFPLDTCGWCLSLNLVLFFFHFGLPTNKPLSWPPLITIIFWLSSLISVPLFFVSSVNDHFTAQDLPKLISNVYKTICSCKKLVSAIFQNCMSVCLQPLGLLQ